VNLYYTEDTGTLSSFGKANSKHAGFISDEEMFGFDNDFFGILDIEAQMMPPIQRVQLEIAFDAFANLGYTLATLKGKRIMGACGDIGIEQDTFKGLREDPRAWSRHGYIANLTCGRAMHQFGLEGPCLNVDTACSASLSAACICHAAVRQHDVKHVDEAFVMGLLALMSPFTLVGLSLAGMLGSRGRCLTFDQYANGYNRGEGCGCIVMQSSDHIRATEDRLACLVGTYINQDGRSASLTAPNGPSQVALIRSSLRQAGLSPNDMSGQEQHGTGTALGDPIEAGTVRTVFRNKDRDIPLIITSAKSHMGHVEAGAGLVSIMKTMVTLGHGAIPSNCHLRELNSNIDVEGFPGYFASELVDIQDYDNAFAGCNGFGFGGTNTRADLWGRRFIRQPTNEWREVSRVLSFDLIGNSTPALKGFEKLDALTLQCPRCLGQMCWLCRAAVPDGTGEGRHRCVDLRTDEASYDYCSVCYEGGYWSKVGGLPNTSNVKDQKVYLAGTWNAWGSPTEMMHTSDHEGVISYEADISLSDVLMEQFHIVLNGDDGVQEFIYPVVKRAGPKMRILGPHKDSQGRRWLINGRHDNVSEGTVYRIRFEWGATRKSISWEATERLTPKSELYQHSYSIVDNICGWKPYRGVNPAPGVWTWSRGQISASGEAQVFFLRDDDQAQMIYPLDPEEMPVMGPDELGEGRRFPVWGAEGEHRHATLRIENGCLSVSLTTGSMGERIWMGDRELGLQMFFIAGSFNKWSLQEMEGKLGKPLYRHRFTIGPSCAEEFQIVVNKNWKMRLYPKGNGDAPGIGLLCGPDRKGNKNFWKVTGSPGQVAEIVLNLAAEDHCKMVACEILV